MHDDLRAAIAEALRSSAGPHQVVAPDRSLPSVYDVSGLAAATIGCAAAEVAALVAERTGHEPTVVVDRGRASTWFASTVEPVDFSVPPVWDAVAGDYPCADGWIRLHTNAAHHRAAALRVLDAPVDRDRVARAVLAWTGADLEAAVVAEGGCAAELRSLEAWRAHPQGSAVGTEPLIAWSGSPAPWRSSHADRPLAGLRVLDLTRVLAGPVCTRFLAGWGADVLRIDPPDWHEPVLEAEVTLGKRCARLDLRTTAGVDVLGGLVAEADVVVHGYRPGALAGLGVGPFDGVVDVALDAYGWTGPWAGRRGFDSLVQNSSGIAAAGMAALADERPRPLPVQALDHATGYLMAAAVVRALRSGPRRARLSLARTAALLVEHPGDLGGEIGAPTSWSEEITAWGTLRRAAPPVTIGHGAPRWDRSATPLGSHRPTW